SSRHRASRTAARTSARSSRRARATARSSPRPSSMGRTAVTCCRRTCASSTATATPRLRRRRRRTPPARALEDGKGGSTLVCGKVRPDAPFRPPFPELLAWNLHKKPLSFANDEELLMRRCRGPLIAAAAVLLYGPLAQAQEPAPPPAEPPAPG